MDIEKIKEEIFRIAFKYNRKDIYGPIEQEWLEEYYLHCEYKHLNPQRLPQRQKYLFELKKEIQKWSETIEKNWKKERRMEWLLNELRELNDQIQKLKNIKKQLGVLFFLDDEFKNIKRKYKRYYLEYGYLKAEIPKEKLDETEIQKLREIPVEELIGSQFFNAGNGRKRMLCPFHQEKTGSFFVFKDNNWHCFGCGQSGNNAIDFIIAYKKYSFKQTIEYLRYY